MLELLVFPKEVLPVSVSCDQSHGFPPSTESKPLWFGTRFHMSHDPYLRRPYDEHITVSSAL
jgi:hypothetical protein